MTPPVERPRKFPPEPASTKRHDPACRDRGEPRDLMSDRCSDETILEAMINQANKTTEPANHGVDEALAYVEESNRRIASMEPAVILMQMARQGNENLVSRAQAKYIASQISTLSGKHEVLLDFAGIPEIGQGFADQLFRVFANANSGVALVPINCTSAVKNMITQALAAAHADEMIPKHGGAKP